MFLQNKLCLLLLSLSLVSLSSFANTVAVSGGGTLTYTVTDNGIGHCGYMGQQQYHYWTFTNFSYTDINGSVWPGTGSAAYYSSPGGSQCPPDALSR